MAYIIKKALMLNGKQRNPGDVIDDADIIPRRALSLVRTGMITALSIKDAESANLAGEELPDCEANSVNDEAGSDHQAYGAESPENDRRRTEKRDDETHDGTDRKGEKRPRKARNQGDA